MKIISIRKAYEILTDKKIEVFRKYDENGECSLEEAIMCIKCIGELIIELENSAMEVE